MKGEGNKTAVNWRKIVKVILFGTIIGVILTLLFTALSTVIMVKMQSIIAPAVMPLAIVSVCLGTFGGGYITARLNQSMGMAVGALCGIMVFVIFLGLGAIFGSELGLMSLIRLIPAVIAGAIGGILGVNRRKRRK